MVFFHSVCYKLRAQTKYLAIAIVKKSLNDSAPVFSVGELDRSYCELVHSFPYLGI